MVTVQLILDYGGNYSHTSRAANEDSCPPSPRTNKSPLASRKDDSPGSSAASSIACNVYIDSFLYSSRHNFMALKLCAIQMATGSYCSPPYSELSRYRIKFRYYDCREGHFINIDSPSDLGLALDRFTYQGYKNTILAEVESLEPHIRKKKPKPPAVITAAVTHSPSWTQHR